MALDLPALRALLASIEARQPRRRELIRWLDDNDMNGLECAATVELEEIAAEAARDSRLLISAAPDLLAAAEECERLRAAIKTARRPQGDAVTHPDLFAMFTDRDGTGYYARLTVERIGKGFV